MSQLHGGKPFDLPQGDLGVARLTYNKECYMKHAIIISHPRTSSFTASAGAIYAEACGAQGHETIVRDLYRMNFDPRLKAGELPFAPSFRPAPDVVAERALLQDCDVFALFYPLWLNAPPAMMKGYLERVFGFGFAYGAGGHSYNPLLNGRKLISFSSSGAPLVWMKQTGALAAVHTLFDDYFAKLCGMTVLDHIHMGGVTPGGSTAFIEARFAEISAAFTKHFGKETCS
jgi:NAD(P)H dehydrogenase (quinone)